MLAVTVTLAELFPCSLLFPALFSFTHGGVEALGESDGLLADRRLAQLCRERHPLDAGGRRHVQLEALLDRLAHAPASDLDGRRRPCLRRSIRGDVKSRLHRGRMDRAEEGVVARAQVLGALDAGGAAGDRRAPEESLAVGAVLVRGRVVLVAGDLKLDDLALVGRVAGGREGAVDLSDDRVGGGERQPSREQKSCAHHGEPEQQAPAVRSLLRLFPASQHSFPPTSHHPWRIDFQSEIIGTLNRSE